MYSTKLSMKEKIGDWFRHLLSCCDREDEEEARPALQISGPTNFRREDISIPGLTPAQQHFIRTKAISDAQKMYPHLQPLRSSPSGHFASPTSPKMPTYEEFTTPRTPRSRGSHGSAFDNTLEKMKRHSRKISNSFVKGPVFGQGYHPVGDFKDMERGDSKYEMRALMDPSETRVVSAGLPAGKCSEESFSVGGSEVEEAEFRKAIKI